MPSFSLRRHLAALALAALVALVVLPSPAGAEGRSIDLKGRATASVHSSYPACDAGMLIDPDGAL